MSRFSLSKKINQNHIEIPGHLFCVLKNMDAFLASQYMCELICSYLDTVSISNLAHTNMRLFTAVADFHKRPKLLVEDDQGDFSRTFNPVTQIFASVRLAPELKQHIERRHPKCRRNKRRIHATDTGHPHAITIESGLKCSMICTKIGWKWSISPSQLASYCPTACCMQSSASNAQNHAPATCHQTCGNCTNRS